MSLLGNIVGHAAATAGRAYDYATPGAGTSSLTNVGRAVYDPNVVLSNPTGIFTRAPAFTPVAQPSAPTDQGGTSDYSLDTASAPASVTRVENADPYYAAQIARINTQLGQLDPQLNVGKQNVLDSYNTAYNDLSGQQGRATRDYNTTRGNTISDEQAAKQNIDTGVRTTTNALQRLFGAAGSGRSSASLVAAPFAAARQGSQQRTQVNNQYGRNLQSLDTGYGDAQNQFATGFNDIGHQRDTQLNSLQSSINTNRAKLLDTLASLTGQRAQAGGQTIAQATSAAQPFANQADALYGGLADLSRQYQNPVVQAAPVAYKPPELGSYNYDQTAAPTTQDPFAGDISPYYSTLFGKDRRGVGA